MSVNKLSDTENLAFLVACWQTAEVKPADVNWGKVCADFDLKSDTAKKRLSRLLAKHENGKPASADENPAGPNTPPTSPGLEKKKAPVKRGRAKATVAKKTATKKTTGAGSGRGQKRKIEQVEEEDENDEGSGNKENEGGSGNKESEDMNWADNAMDMEDTRDAAPSAEEEVEA
ncbi:hypothetical protein BDD12DRAFT_804273 [Trichophaea hybrida]|nr:hypothetical protein BDD12DRAFT_804273 [Trichophaea hybrida]